MPFWKIALLVDSPSSNHCFRHTQRIKRTWSMKVYIILQSMTGVSTEPTPHSTYSISNTTCNFPNHFNSFFSSPIRKRLLYLVLKRENREIKPCQVTNIFISFSIFIYVWCMGNWVFLSVNARVLLCQWWGLRLMSGSILHCSSTLFTESGSLGQI